MANFDNSAIRYGAPTATGLDSQVAQAPATPQQETAAATDSVGASKLTSTAATRTTLRQIAVKGDDLKNRGVQDPIEIDTYGFIESVRSSQDELAKTPSKHAGILEKLPTKVRALGTGTRSTTSSQSDGSPPQSTSSTPTGSMRIRSDSTTQKVDVKDAMFNFYVKKHQADPVSFEKLLELEAKSSEELLKDMMQDLTTGNVDKEKFSLYIACLSRNKGAYSSQDFEMLRHAVISLGEQIDTHDKQGQPTIIQDPLTRLRAPSKASSFARLGSVRKLSASSVRSRSSTGSSSVSETSKLAPEAKVNTASIDRKIAAKEAESNSDPGNFKLKEELNLLKNIQSYKKNQDKIEESKQSLSQKEGQLNSIANQYSKEAQELKTEIEGLKQIVLCKGLDTILIELGKKENSDILREIKKEIDEVVDHYISQRTSNPEIKNGFKIYVQLKIANNPGTARGLMAFRTGLLKLAEAEALQIKSNLSTEEQAALSELRKDAADGFKCALIEQAKPDGAKDLKPFKGFAQSLLKSLK